jgi:hypothetical protein
MKTIYLLKSLVPLIFLPFAPGVVQVELERHGLITYGTSPVFAFLVQIAFTLGIVVWIARIINRKGQTSKAFLKMSCVSKKVFYGGRWMPVEQYLAENHNVVVSHGMTPEEATSWIRESEQWLREEKALDVCENLEISEKEEHILLENH